MQSDFIKKNLCKTCGDQASKVEITSDLYLKYSGPGGWNGLVGDKISKDEADSIKGIFEEPIDIKILKSKFYDQGGYCGVCQCFYCERCWKNKNGFGKCPVGHSQSLDPHWSPDSG